MTELTKFQLIKAFIKFSYLDGMSDYSEMDKEFDPSEQEQGKEQYFDKYWNEHEDKIIKMLIDKIK